MPTQDEVNIRIRVKGREAERNIKRVNKAFKGTSGAISGAASSLNRFKTLLVAGGVFIALRRLTMGLRAVISEAADFEFQLSKVATLVKDTDQIYGEFGDEIDILSVKFGQATNSLSKGLFDIISAGIAGAEAMDVLTASTKLAVGGVTTAGIATKAMITVYQTFSDQLRDATDAADLLFAIQKQGRLTVEQVAQTIGGVAASAQSARMSVEALGTAFSAISRGGEGAETAIVELRMVMEAFTKKGMPESIEAAKKFGIELKATTIEGDGLLEVVGKLVDASAADISAIFNQSRARRGINILINQQSNLLSIYNDILHRSGANQEALNKQLKVAQVQFDRYAEAIKKIKKIIGEELINNFVELATSTADWMQTIEGTETIERFGAALNSLVSSVIFLTSAFADPFKFLLAPHPLADFALDELIHDSKEFLNILEDTNSVINDLGRAGNGIDIEQGMLSFADRFNFESNIIEARAKAMSDELRNLKMQREELEGMLSFADKFSTEFDDALGGGRTDSAIRARVEDIKQMMETLESSGRVTGSNLSDVWQRFQDEVMQNLDLLDKQTIDWVDKMNSRFTKIDIAKTWEEEIGMMKSVTGQGFREMDEEAEAFAFNVSARFKDTTKEADKALTFMQARSIAVSQGMARGFDDFFFSVMRREITSVGDLFDGFLSSIQRSMASFYADQVVRGLLGAPTGKSGSLQGGLLSGIFGKLFKAKGDFATSATPAVFGEKGPEAIMPLRRDSKGNLGVSASGGNEQGGVEGSLIIVNTINPGAMVQAGLADPQIKNVIVNDISGDILKRGTIFKTLRRGM